jgi:hypothetical protein
MELVSVGYATWAIVERYEYTEAGHLAASADAKTRRGKGQEARIAQEYPEGRWGEEVQPEAYTVEVKLN